MLQVEKKKGGRSRRGWLALCLFILAGAGVTLALLTGGEREPLPVREETGGSLVNRDPSEIREMEIQVRGRESWTAVRDADGDLRMRDGEAWTLDAALGEGLEDALAHLVYEDVLSEDPAEYGSRLAEFGLEDPEIRARVVFDGGEEIRLRIGDDSGMEDEDFRFMTVEGDPRLFAVAGSLVRDLTVERELLHPVTQPEIQTGRIDRITVYGPEGNKKAEWILDGEITEADAEWRISFPFEYAADPERMDAMKKNAGNLRMGLYVAEGTEENLEEYGLKEPGQALEIHLAAGSTGRVAEGGAYDVRNWPEETLRILLGKARNEMTDYCLFGGTVYTINHFTAAALTETDPLETASRHPVAEAPENLKSLEILRADGTRVLYEITWNSAPAAEEGGEPETTAACRKNGEDISGEAFLAAYERWRVVEVSGRLPDGWEKGETRETFRIRTLGGKTHTVEISEFDALHDALTVDGNTLFYLIRGGFGEMP